MADAGTIKIPATITITADGFPEPLGTAAIHVELHVTGSRTDGLDRGTEGLTITLAGVRESMARALREAADDIDRQIREERTAYALYGQDPGPTPLHEHQPVQHRDLKEPWCNTCHLNAEGGEPRDRHPAPSPTELAAALDRQKISEL